MNLFDQLVNQALLSQAALGTVRPAVEKELLHHDILRELSRAGLLAGLTFIGGTCLRACYGAVRLSEDLDFTGGAEFDPAAFGSLPRVLEETLAERYGLPVSVSAPVRQSGNVATWKMRLVTRPTQPDLPQQRIHIDVCAVNSHSAVPVLLRNHYGVDMGTDALVIRAQSREEILADKWLALALRPNRVQYRDVWDILWLLRQRQRLEPALLHAKIEDRGLALSAFFVSLDARLADLAGKKHAADFRKEMERFLLPSALRELPWADDYWSAVMNRLRDERATFY